MALTTQQQTELYKLGVGMFNASLGTTYMSQLANQVDAGVSVAQLYNILATSPAFQQQAFGFTSAATNAQFAAAFVDQLTGSTLSSANRTWAIDWITGQLNAGQSRGAVMKAAVDALAAVPTTDANFGAARQQLDNKVTVARDYTETQNGSATDINTLKATVATVTNDSATVTAAITANQTISGATFTLTNGADTLDPNSATASLRTTSSGDQVRAPSDGLLQTTDFIDTGAGVDTLTAAITANSQTLAPSVKNVENITLTVTAVDQKTFTYNAATTTGATTVTIKDASAASQDDYTTPDELITVSNLAKTTTLGIEGGSGTVAANTASAITATFASAAAADTQKVAISNKGTVGLLTLSTAETVEITATGTGTSGANTIEQLAATAVKTLNLKGSGDLTIGASDLASTVTVDATSATGKISFTGENNAAVTFKGGSGAATVTLTGTANNSVTTGAGNDTVNVNVTGNQTVNTGAGDDRVFVGAQANVTADDSLNGGDGTDTLAVSDATINGTTKTALSKGVSGFERLETTATTAVVVDFNALSAYDIVVVSGAMAAGAAANDTAGAASVSVTMENADTLIVSAARAGQNGGTATGNNNGKNGGDAIVVTPFLDAGGNAATIRFVGNADVTGGNGSVLAGTGTTDGSGGDGIDAVNVETLNLIIAGTQTTAGADTVTVANGTRGGANGGAVDGQDVIVSANATINITSELEGSATKHNNLDLGTVEGTNVTINAASFKGNLTVTAADGNVTITGGSGADNLTGGAGVDTINGGTGNDIINGVSGKDVLTGGGGRDAFTIATQTNTTFQSVTDFGKVTAAATATEVQAMNNVANFQATATGKGGADADILDLAPGTLTLTAVTSFDASASSGNAGKAITGSISAKGLLTLTGADAGLVDTVAEYVALLQTQLAANEIAVFEVGGNSYVFHETDNAGNSDTVVQLTGVTGITGIVVGGSSVAAAVGDIIVV